MKRISLRVDLHLINALPYTIIISHDRIFFNVANTIQERNGVHALFTGQLQAVYLQQRIFAGHI